MTDDLDSASGWDAIDAALEPIYGTREPEGHWGTIISYRLGGPDPLDGVSAYARTEPVPHWHYVTYGFTDLHDDGPGYRHELTMRVRTHTDERRVLDEPPIWPVALLQNVARYTFSSGNVLSIGDHVDLAGPLTYDHPTRLTALTVVADPELGEFETAAGTAHFRQIVGVTAGEYGACQDWATARVMELLAPHLPAFTTDVDRGDLLTDPALAQRVTEGIARDGSRTGTLYGVLARLDLQERRLELDRDLAAMALRVLPGRLPHGKPLQLYGPDGDTVGLHPTGRDTLDLDDDGDPIIELSDRSYGELMHALGTADGAWQMSTIPGLSIAIRPS